MPIVNFLFPVPIPICVVPLKCCRKYFLINKSTNDYVYKLRNFKWPLYTNAVCRDFGVDIIILAVCDSYTGRCKIDDLHYSKMNYIGRYIFSFCSRLTS